MVGLLKFVLVVLAMASVGFLNFTRGFLASKALKAISGLWLSSLVGAVVAFLVQAVLARNLEPVEFGEYVTVLAVVTLLSPFIGFGIGQFWLRVFAQESVAAKRWLAPSYRLFLLLAMFFVVGLILWALFLPHNESMKVLYIYFMFHMVSIAVLELAVSRCQIDGRYYCVSLMQVSHHLIRLAGVLFVLVLGLEFNSSSIGMVYALAGIITIFTSLLILKRGGLGEGWALNYSEIGLLNVVKGAWPYWAASIAYLAYSQGVVILVSHIVDKNSAAIYSLAFSIVAVAYLLPTAIFQRYLVPKIHVWAVSDRRKMRKIYTLSLKIMLVIGFVVGVLINLTAEYLVLFLFGVKYLGAVDVLKVLSFSVPFMYVAFSAGAFLVAQVHVLRKVFVMTTVAVISVFLNCYFLSSYGVIAAATTAIFSNLILMALYHMLVNLFVFKE